MTATPDDLITPGRAARILRLNVKTVYRWIVGDRKADPPTPPKIRSWKRAGTRYMVSEADVRALLEPTRPDQQPPPESRQQLDARRDAARERLRSQGVA